MPLPFSYKFFSTTAAAWEAMFSALQKARELIYWEIYMFFDDEQGNKFVEILCAKARAGVEVKLILDAVGSLGFSSAEKLRQAGAEVLWYNPILVKNFFKRWRERIWRRNHRKVLVIDGCVGFIGGVNVHATHRDWQDLHLQITGQAARSLLYGFARSYVKSGGDKKNMKKIFHPHLAAGFKEWRDKIRFIFSSPEPHSRRRLKQLFYDALAAAKKSVTLVTPYYAPDRDFLRLLEQAARRGVRIDLIMPARTDMEFMEILAQKYFKKMQEWGVNIYLSDSMNHGKVLAVDDQLGMVGSVNLTRRSFGLNEEAGAYFTNEDMVNDLNKIVADWKKNARPFATVKIHARGWWRRTKEWFANKIEKYV